MKPKILLSVNQGRELYESAVDFCGAEPIAKYLPEVSAEGYDGLILGGGNDLHPSYYGEEINGASDFDLARDECEFALAEAFIQKGKPVFGICRGGQLLNVFFGGTLYQHLPCSDEHKHGDDASLGHGVHAQAGSVFEKLYGTHFAVNSFHHQAVKSFGKGLKGTLFADGNEVVEGFEHETLPIIGVQWHPEQMCLSAKRQDVADGLPLIQYFVDLCKR